MKFMRAIVAGAGLLSVGLAEQQHKWKQRQRYGAMPSMTDSPALIPRYFVDRSFALAKRQNDCNDDDTHSCK
mgnify:CR=1 FL=1